MYDHDQEEVEPCFERMFQSIDQHLRFHRTTYIQIRGRSDVKAYFWGVTYG